MCKRWLLWRERVLVGFKWRFLLFIRHGFVWCRVKTKGAICKRRPVVWYFEWLLVWALCPPGYTVVLLLNTLFHACLNVVWLWAFATCNCRYFPISLPLGFGKSLTVFVCKGKRNKKKKSHALGVPVATAKHNCKEKAIAVEQELVSRCKNPHRFYGNVVSQRGGVVPCVMYVQSAVLVHSSVASFSFWDLVFLPYFKIHSPHFCQTSFISHLIPFVFVLRRTVPEFVYLFLTLVFICH